MSTHKNNIYLLRWLFEYENGGKKFGMWQHPGPKDDLHTKAWANNKGVKYATIERKDTTTAEIKEIVRCHANEFMNFQWITVAKHNFMSGNLVHRVVGLTLLSTRGAVNCYIDGTITKEEPKHLDVEFKTFGK